jgi:hypothetical protein
MVFRCLDGKTGQAGRIGIFIFFCGRTLMVVFVGINEPVDRVHF